MFRNIPCSWFYRPSNLLRFFGFRRFFAQFFGFNRLLRPPHKFAAVSRCMTWSRASGNWVPGQFVRPRELNARSHGSGEHRGREVPHLPVVKEYFSSRTTQGKRAEVQNATARYFSDRRNRSTHSKVHALTFGGFRFDLFADLFWGTFVRNCFRWLARLSDPTLKLSPVLSVSSAYWRWIRRINWPRS